MRVFGYIQDIHQRKSTELERARSEARLHTLIQMIPDLVWLKDPAGVYLSCNIVFEQIFGLKSEEILGKSDFDLFDIEKGEIF